MDEVLEVQHQSFQRIVSIHFLKNWLVSSLCSPKNSQESSPAPQFESINSSALSLLSGPTLTSVHDYWKTIALTTWTSIGQYDNMYFPFLIRDIYSDESHSIVFGLWRLKNSGLVSKLAWYQRIAPKGQSLKTWVSAAVSVTLPWEIGWLWVPVACLSNKDTISAWECFETQIHLWLWRIFENVYVYFFKK